MTKKISSKSNFELCFLRHQYLRKANINPTKEDFQPYNLIIHTLAGKNYSVYKKLFYAVGFDFSDIVRIAEAHLVSFLGLFHIEKDPKKYDKFVEAFCEKNKILPNDRDTLDKNKAIFTIFLKQRMEDLIRVCRQKVRNIRGVPMKEFHIFSGPNPPLVGNLELVNNCEKHGYRKLDTPTFRAIKKKAKPSNPLCFQFNKVWYISIPTDYKPLELLDFSNAGLDPRDTLHNRSPEDLIIMSENTKKWEREYKKFKKTLPNRKADMIRSFIDLNKGSSLFAEELRTAKKMLARLES
jgi:hypothetical protein